MSIIVTHPASIFNEEKYKALLQELKESAHELSFFSDAILQNIKCIVDNGLPVTMIDFKKLKQYVNAKSDFLSNVLQIADVAYADVLAIGKCYDHYSSFGNVKEAIKTEILSMMCFDVEQEKIFCNMVNELLLKFNA